MGDGVSRKHKRLQSVGGLSVGHNKILELTSSSIIEDIWSYKIIDENNPNNEDSINKLTTWGV